MLQRCLPLTLSAIAAVSALTACGGDKPTSEAQTVTVTASPSESGVTWKYLQDQYGEYLARRCDIKTMDDPTYNACIGLQNAGLDSFERDAIELQPSKSRADLLSAIDRWKNNYSEFSDNMCQLDRTKMKCFAPGYGIMSFDLFQTIVDREAAK